MDVRAERQRAAHVPGRQADERIEQCQWEGQDDGLQPYQPAHHDQQIGQQQRERNPRQQIEREPALFGNQGMHVGLVRSAAG